MFVEVKVFDFDDNLVFERSYVRKNNASLTRKVNDTKRYISGRGYDLYGPCYCDVYVNDSHYCRSYYNPSVFKKGVTFYAHPTSL